MKTSLRLYRIIWKDPERTPLTVHAHHIKREPTQVKFFGDPEGLAGMAHAPFATLTDLTGVERIEEPT